MQQQEQQEQTLEFQKYLQIFLRRKVLIIIILLISLVFSTISVLMMPDVYMSKCVLLVKGSSKLDKVLSDRRRGPVGSDAREMFGTIKEKMLGWEGITQALEACGLTEDLPADDPKVLEALYFATVKHVRIRAKGGNLTVISYEGENPYINYKMLDHLVSSFMEHSLKWTRTQADDSLDFIDKDLVRLREKLAESERKLQGFEEKHLADLPLSESSRMKELRNVENGLVVLERQIMVENERLIALTTKLEKEDPSVTGEIVKEINPKAAELESRIISNEILVSNLLMKYYDGHPSIKRAEKRLKMLKERLAEETESVISKETFVTNPIYTNLLEKKFEMELQEKALYTRKKDMVSQIAKLQEQVIYIPALRQELGKLQEVHNINRGLYKQRMQQRSKAELEKELSLSTSESPFTILEPPRISYTPQRTKKMKKFLMGIVLGGMAAFGLAFGLEQIDQRFKGVDDARDFLPLPVFGMIPTIITEGDLLKSRRRKRRRLISAGVVALLLILLTTVCFKIEPVNEAMLAGFEKIQKKVGYLK